MLLGIFGFGQRAKGRGGAGRSGWPGLVEPSSLYAQERRPLRSQGPTLRVGECIGTQRDSIPQSFGCLHTPTPLLHNDKGPQVPNTSA